MKKILEAILRQLARGVVKKYKPIIIGITGSVGKTSTKEAVHAVMKSRFNVRSSLKNYNNEIGVPLTILNRTSANHSLKGWLAVIAEGIRLLIVRDKDYPQHLILEMGADRPGDMAYLLRIVSPDAVIITYIAGVHLQFFQTIENIVKEKFSITNCLASDKPVFLNSDNKEIEQYRHTIADKKVITYGFNTEADIRAYAERLRLDSANPYRVLGIEFTLSYRKQEERMYLPGVISRSQIYAALAGAGIGMEYGMTLEQVREALKSYHLPAGRMKMLPGIKHTLIVDDTYNASPSSGIAALISVHRLPKKAGTHCWAVFGDMLELGKESPGGHHMLGEKTCAYDIDYLITVGLRAKEIARGAEDGGMSKNRIYSFDDTTSAGKFLEDRIESGDIILIKGSQGARMEKIVKEVMAEPLRAKELLVRQDSSWM